MSIQDSVVSNEVTELHENKNSTQEEKPQEIIIDKQEYLQVFRMFDKTNSGEIQMNDVYSMINLFENQEAATDNNNMSIEYKFDFKSNQGSFKGSANQKAANSRA